MKSTAALLAVSWALLGASCEERPTPPVPVEVKVAVQKPCDVPEPECRAPAYDGARKDQPGDAKLRLLRAEAITQEDCVRRLREALKACRGAPAQKP